MRKIALLLVAFALVASACSKSTANKSTTASLTVGNVPSEIKGDVLTIPVTVKGIKIVPPNGDISGKTGHFHIFVDRLPIKPGKPIPEGVKNIVHSADNPIKIYGLTPGEHKLHIVLGNGSHVRIDPNARAVVKVKVDGPSVQGSLASPTVAKGADVVVNLKAEGVKIVDPGTESGSDEGHFHVLVDPATPPKAGDMIQDSSTSYMTGASSQTIKGLTPGKHVIFVVLADKDHKAWDPPVMDMLKVTVGS